MHPSARDGARVVRGRGRRISAAATTCYTTASRGSLKCHRIRNCVGFVSASSTARAHNLDLLLHRSSNPGAVLKRVVSKLPSADAR